MLQLVSERSSVRAEAQTAYVTQIINYCSHN